MEYVKHVARIGERIVVYRILVGKLELRRPIARPSLRWEDNIKMNFQEMECGGFD